MKSRSYTAYAAMGITRISEGASGCLLWFGNLMDMKETESNEDIYIRMAGAELGTRCLPI